MSHPQVRLWRQETDLQTLQATLHDDAPLDRLMDRGRMYRDAMLRELYPQAAPAAGSKVLEVGPGVGWIMEAMLEGFPEVAAIVGVDVSPTVAREAHRRWPERRALFTAYDGLRFPFPDDRFDLVYSCAALQHVEKHWAFFALSEMYRTLRPGGHAVVHLMSVHHIPRSPTPFQEEARRHVEMRGDSWWMHYYSYDELFVLLSEVIGVDDLDIKPMHGVDTLCVHFSKGTGRRFLRPEVEALTYPVRVGSEANGELNPEVASLRAELAMIKGSRAWRLACAMRRVRRLVPGGR